MRARGMSAPSRRCIVVRGTHEETWREAHARTHGLDAAEVVWASPDAPEGVRAVSVRALDALLGQSVDAVVLDLHGAIDPDAIARAEGLVRAGGALVLRMPPLGAEPARRGDLALHPYVVHDVGTRFARRFESLLPAPDAHALEAPSHQTRASPEQDALVARLGAMFDADAPRVVVLLADRGRGKSAALGRALAHARRTRPLTRLAVTASSRDAAREVFRFGGDDLPFVEPGALARGACEADVLVVDEAAQLPIALVKQIVLAHPGARIVLATTCRGYEGTGRGFAIRFVAWARARFADRVEELSLTAPIRWASGDPLERWAFDALLLDAEPAVLAPRATVQPRHVHLDRDRLAQDERTVRQLFGLLVQAHYRTTPADLARLLDAPNLEVHALFEEDDVVAASLVAHEGELPPSLTDAMARGQTRIAGHALADTLVSHALRPELGGLAMLRSVRIAVHEQRRRRGLARQLVEAVHASYAPDLFGTVFGATAELVRFRRSLGYEIVRVGVARGARSGEPAIVMVRPVSEAARAGVALLRTELAHELETQLALLASDEGASVDPALRAALFEGLPSPPPRSVLELREVARRYAESAQPLDVVAGSLERFVRAHQPALEGLAPPSARLLEKRLLERAPWPEVARAAALESVPAAMRAMRRSVLALLRAVEAVPGDPGARLTRPR